MLEEGKLGETDLPVPFKGIVATVAVSGASFILYGYAIASGLVNIPFQRTGDLPCPLSSPELTLLTLSMIGGLLLLLSLLVWLLRSRVARTAHGPFRLPMDRF